MFASYFLSGKKPYLCSICGAEFNHSANLATHTRCVHLQVKPYVCNVCGGKYSKRSQLDDHVLSHSTERQFTCRYIYSLIMLSCLHYLISSVGRELDCKLSDLGLVPEQCWSTFFVFFNGHWHCTTI